MKPRTRIQQEVARLSKRLPRLNATQKAYAFRHCFKHYAIKRADGTNICTECGHSWKSDHDLADTLCGCICPHCSMQLEVLRTRKSVFSENEYFSQRHNHHRCPTAWYVNVVLRPMGGIQRHGDTQEQQTSRIRYNTCVYLSPTAFHPRTETQRLQRGLLQYPAV